MKAIRKFLLKSSRVRKVVAESKHRMKDQARAEHLVEAIFRGGCMKL